MRSKWLKLSMLFVGLFMILLSIDWLISLRIKAFDKGDWHTAKVNRLMSGKIDYPLMIWGASTAYMNFSPALIDSIAGTRSFNMGLNGIVFQQYQGFLRHHLSYTRQTRHLVIALNVGELWGREQITMVEYFYPYVSNEEVYGALYGLDPVLAFKMRYVPLYQLTFYELPNLIKKVLPDRFTVSREREDRGGFYANPTHTFSTNWAAAPRHFRIAHEKLQDLREVVRLCRAKGIVPIVCLVPYYKKGQELIDNLPEVRMALSSLEQDGAVYMDFLDHPVCGEERYFYNILHLNDKGAEIFSAAFAEKLKPLLQ